jgi:hypothetical protein
MEQESEWPKMTALCYVLTQLDQLRAKGAATNAEYQNGIL